jgi:hypothetical protein
MKGLKPQVSLKKQFSPASTPMTRSWRESARVGYQNKRKSTKKGGYNHENKKDVQKTKPEQINHYQYR